MKNMRATKMQMVIELTDDIDYEDYRTIKAKIERLIEDNQHIIKRAIVLIK